MNSISFQGTVESILTSASGGTPLGSDFMGAVVTSDQGKITISVEVDNAEYAHITGQLKEGDKVTGLFVIGGDGVKRATKIQLAL